MTFTKFRLPALLLAASIVFTACGKNRDDDPASKAPPAAQVESEQDGSLIQVDHPEQFPVTPAVEHSAASELVVTGSVSPDIERTVPVISVASGRVVDIRARLGDTVRKGQLLMQVQSTDVSSAFSDYRKALADETLIHTQLNRAKDLNAHGATSLNDLQVAQDAEDKAKVDVETASEHLRLLGNDPDHPSAIVGIVAPISGVITDQQVTNAAGIQGLSSTNPFTISDLSSVWILCDVYENDLPMVRLGEEADVRLNAYPTQLLRGKIGNIGAILDPTLRTAKVRIELRNPGFARPGMFASATFHGLHKESHVAVPASAILHLHDRDWVYTPESDGKFRRLEVVGGPTLPSQMQEVVSGLPLGQKVVTNALALQNTVDND